MIAFALFAAAAGANIVQYHCQVEAALGRDPAVTNPAELKSVTLNHRDLREGKFDMALDLTKGTAQISASPDVLSIAGERKVSEYKPIPVKNGTGSLITFALAGDAHPTLSCSAEEGNACRSVVRIAAYDFEGAIDFNVDPATKLVGTKGLDRFARIVGQCQKSK